MFCNKNNCCFDIITYLPEYFIIFLAKKFELELPRIKWILIFSHEPVSVCVSSKIHMLLLLYYIIFKTHINIEVLVKNLC